MVKKCIKKVCCACRVVVLSLKPNAFLTSSLLSPSSLLDLPAVGYIDVFLFGRFELVHPSYVNIT